jgi:hypothetical protein
MKTKIALNGLNRRGFLLYIVIAVLFALAIMAFALNSLKSGAVTQLAKNVDQNRLTLLAQSANAEVIAGLRSKVNVPGSETFQKFRSVFPGSDGTFPPLNQPILISSMEPPLTLAMAQSAGYNLKIKSRAVMYAYREAPANSVTALNAYLDVYSQAYREGFEQNLIEVHERRDVRLVDLRHRLDKYALFVKNYCPDYNNPRRRIIVDGIEGSGPFISQAFLGNNNYPDCADPDKLIWLDAFYEETSALPGFSSVTGAGATLKKFPNSSSPNCLFTLHSYPFASLKGISISQFYNVKTVIDLYEKFVNEAANGAIGSVQPFATKEALRQKCRQGMDASNSNSAAYDICEDFYNNFNSAGDGDYSGCSGFMKILNTCIEEWDYVYGFTDAASLWRIEDDIERPQLTAPHGWATALAFGGLATTTAQYRNKGPYFSEYLDKKDGKIYNPEKIRVGRMAKFYGKDCDRKLLIEGPVFLRYFKLGFLDTFSKTIQFYNDPKDITPEPVPLNFYRYDKSKTFLNTRLAETIPAGGVLSEDYLMSREIASFPINVLMGNNIAYINGDGDDDSLSPLTPGQPNFTNPLQPAATNYSGNLFGRLIDFNTVSWNYANPEQFLSERVAIRDGVKTLFLDGVIYIEQGDLDLSDVEQFYGKGMIYLGKGNCFIGDFKKIPDRQTDTVRFYLRAGDFIIRSANSNVEIHASLAAFYYPFGSANQLYQGSLILSGKSQVTIVGNLLVDYLYTQSSSGNGLALDGVLHIKHDPFIYDAAAGIGDANLDPYTVSIGPVKSLYSINAGGKTF